jgi:ABC-type glycerol-3-phosphate transport system permease component
MEKNQMIFGSWNIHKKRKVNSIILNVSLMIGAIVTIFPLVWMFLSSVKPMKEIIKMPPDFFPREPTVGNFVTLFETLPFLRFLLNSVIVTVLSTLILVFVCAIAGFVFAKFNFSGKKILYSLILLTMMIVDEVLVLPLYMMITEVQLNNTYAALILPFLATGFGVFLMRQFITSIPSELIEAATIDGASYLKIFTKIIIPLIKPALSSLTIFNFIWMWNMLMWPVVVVDSESMMTLQIAMSRFTSMYMTRYDLTMAAATIATIPVLIIYVLLQKNFVKGIALTGLKQ